MASKSANLRVNISGHADKLVRAFDKSMGAIDRVTSRLGQKAKRFAVTFQEPVTQGLVAASNAVKAWTFDSIAAASDAAEAQSKVGVVFEQSARRVIQASKNSAVSVGLASGQYLEATGTLGNLLVSTGMASDKAADMSMSMVQLAADLASFNNASPEEALDAIRSGLVGESEPLKRFGVNLNEAAIKASALKMGLVKTTKEGLTPQQKALAVQKLLMEQTATAQGDFMRTSDGLANTQRKTAAQTANLKESIGKLLLPAYNQMQKVLSTKIIPFAQKFVTEMQNGTGAGGTFRDVLEKVRAVLGFVFDVGVKIIGFLIEYNTQVVALGTALAALILVSKAHTAAMAIQNAGGLVPLLKGTKLITAATKVWTAVQWLMNAALTANPIGIVIAAIAALVAGIILAYKNSETFRKVVDTAFKAIAAAGRWLWNNALAPVIRFIVNGFAKIVDGIAWFLEMLGNIPGFGWAKDAARKMKGAADKARELARGIRDIPDRKATSVSLRVAVGGDVGTFNSIMRRVGGRRKLSAMVRGYASGGTNIPAGLAWVGEEGPELIDVPGGSNIYDAQTSKRMAKKGSGGGSAALLGGSGGPNIYITIQGSVWAAKDLAKELVNPLRDELVKVGRRNNGNIFPK